jgi:hypothetical protein
MKTLSASTQLSPPQPSGAVSDGGGFDFAVHFELKTVDMAVAISVGEGEERCGGGAEVFVGIGGGLSELNDVHRLSSRSSLSR